MHCAERHVVVTFKFELIITEHKINRLYEHTQHTIIPVKVHFYIKMHSKTVLLIIIENSLSELIDIVL